MKNPFKRLRKLGGSARRKLAIALVTVCFGVVGVNVSDGLVAAGVDVLFGVVDEVSQGE